MSNSKYERIIGVHPQFADYLAEYAKKESVKRGGEKVGMIKASRVLLDDLMLKDSKKEERAERVKRVKLFGL
jgi:hypothetical protein